MTGNTTRRHFLETVLAGCAWSLPCASALGQLASQDNAFQIRPTHLYKQEGDELRQMLLVEVPGAREGAVLELQIRNKVEKFTLSKLLKIAQSYYVPITPVEQEERVQARLSVSGRVSENFLMVPPVRRWKVFLHHTSQQTPGFVDLPSKVRADFVPYLDSAMEYCQRTNDWPADAQFKWNALASYLVDDYHRARGEAKMKELMDWVRKGRIGIGPGYSIMLPDLMGLETLHRSIYYVVNRLSREYNVNFEAMLLNDITGFPWGFVGVMAKAGLKYMLWGPNPYRSNVDNAPILFYLIGPDGSEVLVLRTAYYEASHLMLRRKNPYPPFQEIKGTDVHGGEPAIAPYFDRYEQAGYPFDTILLQVACDYVPPTIEISDFVRTWNSLWAYPRFHLSTTPEFFRYIEEHHRSQIPHVPGGVPSSWVDLQTPEAHAMDLQRRTENDLPQAEQFATLAQLVAEGPARQDEMLQAYNQLVLWNDEVYEWTDERADIYVDESQGGGKRHWEEKLAYLQFAQATGERVEKESLKLLASNIAKRTSPTIAVWNPVSWTRSELARLALPAGVSAPFRLRDVQTGKEVPYQIEKHPDSGGGVVFLAEEVPALGYRSYVLEPGAAAPIENAISLSESGLENQFYKAGLSDKNLAVVSLFDKRLKREFVDPHADHAFNELVYRLDKELSIRRSTTLGQIPPRQSYSTETAPVISKGEEGPIYGSLRMVGGIDNILEFEHEVRLFAQLKRVEFHNRIHKKPVYARESVFYAFPFRIPPDRDPEAYELQVSHRNQFKLDVPGAIMEPDAEQIPGSTRDNYIPQHWVSMARRDYGALWSSADAPVVQLGRDIHTEEYIDHFNNNDEDRLATSCIYSHIMSNHWNMDIAMAQGGDYLFRYAVTTHGPDWTYNEAHHFGWGFRSPLRVFVLEDNATGSWPEPSRSFVQLHPENVYLVAFKSAEDGDGVILRLYEGAGLNSEAVVSFNLPGRRLSAAWLCDGKEQNISSLGSGDTSVRVSLKPFEVGAIRAVFK